MHFAAESGHLDIVKYLIDDEKVSLYKKDYHGETALHYAARNGHLDVVKYFVDDKKASLYHKTRQGETILYLAVGNGHLDIVKYLMDDKDYDLRYWRDLDCANAVLNLAARRGQLDIIKYLVDDKNGKIYLRGHNSTTVFHSAILGNKLKIVEYLIEDKNIRLYLNFANGINEFSLHLAAQNGHLEIVQYLISKGFTINKGRYYGRTALHCTAGSYAINFHLETFQYLIENGADINSQDNNRKTPLDLAAESQNMAAIELIVNHIAKLNTADLYVSEKNLHKKDEFINSSNERHNNYEQHLRKCKEEIIRLKNKNKSLYDLLIEKDTDALVDIWEKNENLINELSNLQEQYPEYAHILINKANEVKKEIFLYNNKPLIDALSTLYRYDFRTMTCAGLENFFEVHKNDFREGLRSNIGITLSQIPDFYVERRVVPKLKVTTLQTLISSNQITKNSSRKDISKVPVNIDIGSIPTVSNTEAEANLKDSQCSNERNVADNSDTSAISINSNKIIGNFTHSVHSAFNNEQNNKRFSTEVDDKHTVDDIISSNASLASITGNRGLFYHEKESYNNHVEEVLESQKQVDSKKKSSVPEQINRTPTSPTSTVEANGAFNGKVSAISTQNGIINNTPNPAQAVNNKESTSFWSEHKGKIALGFAGLSIAGAVAAYMLAYPIVAIALVVSAAAVLIVAGIVKACEKGGPETENSDISVHPASIDGERLKKVA